MMAGGAPRSEAVRRAHHVIENAWVEGRPYDLASQAAFALESAQLLQSPETAAEHERLRARVAELEAVISAATAASWMEMGDSFEEALGRVGDVLNAALPRAEADAAPEPPCCRGCGHAERDHVQRPGGFGADFHVRRPWCHGCDAECTYLSAEAAKSGDRYGPPSDAEWREVADVLGDEVTGAAKAGESA